MRSSDDKIDHLADRVLQRLMELEDEDESIMVMGEDGEIRAVLRLAMIDFLRREELLHEKVRRKIASMRKGIPEGSPEWNALYGQFLRDETEGRRRIR